MSHHIPSIGQSDPSLQYQAFLDRREAARLADLQAEMRRQARLKALDQTIVHAPNYEEEAESEPGAEQQEEPAPEENSDNSGNGFGTHYA